MAEFAIQRGDAERQIHQAHAVARPKRLGGRRRGGEKNGQRERGAGEAHRIIHAERRRRAESALCRPSFRRFRGG